MPIASLISLQLVSTAAARLRARQMQSFLWSLASRLGAPSWCDLSWPDLQLPAGSVRRVANADAAPTKQSGMQ